MSGVSGPPPEGKGHPAEVFHGQKTIDRREEVLPPAWIRDAHSRQAEPQANAPEGARVILVDQAGAVRGRLVSLVDGAKKVVCACSFLIADEYVVKALLRAHERGVRVYLLTASENQLLKEPRADSEFDIERLQDHVKTLRSLAGRVLVRTGEHFHSKFVLVDPNGTEARGVLLTANLTAEALTRNVEAAVELDPAEVRDLFRQFLVGFWTESSNELLDQGGLSRVDPRESLSKEIPSELPCTTGSDHTLKDEAVRLIDESTGEIIVAYFGFDLQHSVVMKLVAAARAGRNVRVYARPRPNKTTMEALIALREAGAVVRGHPWLHAKCLLAETEGKWAGLVTTANFEKRGLDEGFETGVPLDSGDAEAMRAYAGGWDESFPFELLVQKKVGEVEGEATLWVNDELRRVSIKGRGEMELGEFRVKKADELEKFTPDFSKVAGRGSEIYHLQTFRWTTLAPKA